MTAKLDKGTALDGRFRIEELIGAGGMGAVYSAWDLQQDHRVAIKVLEARATQDGGLRERFLAESSMATRLTHPNILPVHAHGEDEGRLYMAMPLVETDLGALLERDERLDVTRALNIADQVAWALDVAHAQGLVHRDVKPENVLLAPRRAVGEPDVAYLADFGIAKLGDAPGLTRTGAFLGTANYASPEQAGAEPVDGRSDQYALACMLFESLTGRPPFAGADVTEVLAAHREAPRPRVSEYRPRLARLDETLARGLAVDPDARFPTCRELVAQVRAVAPATPAAPEPGAAGATDAPADATLVGAPPTVRAPTAPTAVAPSSSRRLWIAMAGVVALVTVAAVLVALLAGDQEPADSGTPTTAQDTATQEDDTPEDPPGPSPEPAEPSDQEAEVTPGDEDTAPQTELIIGDDGCTLTRGELPDEDELEPNWWFTDDEEGTTVFERDALGETSYRYTEPGRYRVALRTGGFSTPYGVDVLLSNRVTVEC